MNKTPFEEATLNPAADPVTNPPNTQIMVPQGCDQVSSHVLEVGTTCPTCTTSYSRDQE
jgi:hypothetical protein